MKILESTLSLMFLLAALLACSGGKSIIKISSPSSALEAPMLAAGCKDLKKRPNQHHMECPDGSNFYWSSKDMPEYVTCSGAANGKDKCAAGLRKYGATPDSVLMD